MWSLLDLSDRAPLSFETFILLFLPSLVLYYVTNVLAVLGPSTRLYRLALLPLTLLSAFRTAVSLDIAKGWKACDAERLAYMNQALVLAMFTVSTRSICRTFDSTPQRVRIHQPPVATRWKQIALDAADLTFSLRGYGWNWSAGLKMPPYTRPLAPRSAFLLRTLMSIAGHLFVFDILHNIGQSFDPSISIYDPTLRTQLLRYYLRSFAYTLIVGYCIYCAVHVGNDLFSLVGVILLGQSPAEWPPVFNLPWLCTSLTDFWASGWHQVFRYDFLTMSKPLWLVGGRVGGVLGAFLVSGVLHYVGLWGLGKGSDIRVPIFFLTQGVGIILERMWGTLLGQKVGGPLGWLWMFGWVVGFGHLMADPWCQSGIMASAFLPHAARPSVLVQRYFLDIQ
ncbi:hypothetical protein C8J57DRAFT_1170058 [Mycena rebaudengoi]|nr:hypothetical protein C8J57DRAFT_1170058 [Mycena rebaudengoi]